ncbi:hypothetical protein BGW38_009984 [Lunasporangiospora selenospora]|uniref:Uncharacterized protein n=1 Tax=Lunasporangiospora selenospora TaxID=979761 RepID=A0A9P6G2S7_9FUNG|nr:hypothetical protein BGW38_009984 [Lunasporangiospora selenospora]
MRFSVAILLVAALASVNAQKAEYSFKPNGDCVQGCLNKVGKGEFSNWSLDPASPYFIESLSYENDKGTPKYSKFMMNAGMCMTSCSKEEQDIYRAQFQVKNDWYMANKDTYGKNGNGTTTQNSSASKSVVSGLVGAAVALSAIVLV